MTKVLLKSVLTVVAALFLVVACDLENKTPNIFTTQDDLAFGLQMKEELMANTAEYPMLSESEYPEAYDYINAIKQQLLNSGEVAYDEYFPWEVHIVDKDVVNAFATPGGYLYFYTGLIFALENEAQFAGVMAHEMAHCARRHSTNQMTKAYGIQLLLSIVLGEDPSQIATIAADLAGGLASLKFSRVFEYEADEYAIKYMVNGTGGHHPEAMADFFDLLNEMQGDVQEQPVFLSTHPYIEDRRERMLDQLNLYPNVGGEYYEEAYLQFKNMLGQE